MKVLLIGGDPALQDSGSEVARRIRDYAKVLGQCDVLLLPRVRSSGTFQLSAKSTVHVRGGRITRFLRGLWWGARKIRKGRYDVISSQDVEHAALAWLFSKLTGVPWQMQIHTDIFSPHFARVSSLNRARHILAQFLIPRADGIRAVSSRIKDSLARFKVPDTRIAVLPIFVDVKGVERASITVDLKKKYPRFRQIVFMASRLSKEKDIRTALRAFGRALQEVPGTGLVIAGEGPEARAVRGKIHRLGLERSVTLEGWVPYETFLSYAKSADVFLHTSRYEGYGLALAQAAAARRPIVSTEVGIAREIEGAKVVPVGDISALERALVESLQRPRSTRFGATMSYEEHLRAFKETLVQCLHSSSLRKR
jgi:glycosyltransferase involved in cell wall biosynthesis